MFVVKMLGTLRFAQPTDGSRNKSVDVRQGKSQITNSGAGKD
jgi:hypothetical protein